MATRIYTDSRKEHVELTETLDDICSTIANRIAMEGLGDYIDHSYIIELERQLEVLTYLVQKGDFKYKGQDD